MAQPPIAILRSRIKSVESIRKITKAQELIAAAHIVRARDRLTACTPHAEKLAGAPGGLAPDEQVRRHPLLQCRTSAPRVAIVMVTSERGQCGTHNTQVFERTESLVRRVHDSGGQTTLQVVGRKGIEYCQFHGHSIDNTWPAFGLESTYRNSRQLGQHLVDLFLCGTAPAEANARGGEDHSRQATAVDEVHIVYNEFVSNLVSTATSTQLLPIDLPAVSNRQLDSPKYVVSYRCEPAPTLLLDALGLAHVQSQIHLALVESCAAEIAARRVAMATATDNATAHVEDLRLSANRSRQDQITEQVIEDARGYLHFAND